MSSMAGGGGGGGELWRSASTIAANTASGYHILKIDGYSRTLETTPTGECIKSLPFTVGGHRWHIRYFPNGNKPENKDYISLHLCHHDSAAKPVQAQIKFRFVGELSPLTMGALRTFNKQYWGDSQFIKREDLERSKHLRVDSFTIRCDVVVVTNEFRVEEMPEATAAATMIPVPPSDLHQHLGSLLLTEKGADVVFDVAGETFAAHRCVLAARSPVFSAELFGAMKESDTGGVVRIEDMEPRVFKALLYFVYTDLLFPKTLTMREANEGDMDDEEDEEEGVFSQHILTKEADEEDKDDDDDDEDDEEDVLCQHLLVAADRYNLERLKLLCESKLCEYIDVGTVASILALAEQHHGHELKKACFHFLSSPANLRAAVASDDFEHLSRSCPSLMVELFAMLGNLVP